MAKILKRGRNIEQSTTEARKVRDTVVSIIDDIETRGEAALREYSSRFDKWSPTAFRLSESEIEGCLAKLSKRNLEDIRFAQTQVRNFAQAQRNSMSDVEVETLPGVVLGHKNLPVESVGCYVPGGKYPLVASAHMGVVTAKVAGVPRVDRGFAAIQGRTLACGRSGDAFGRRGRDLLYGRRAGDRRHGHRLRWPRARPCIVGPGNAYVAEAKRQLFGRVGIDLFAGPTETLVIADDSVDAEICATDLLGQAEHGSDTPAVLLTTSEKLARATMFEIDRLLTVLPTAEFAACPGATTARSSSATATTRWSARPTASPPSTYR